MLFGTQKREKNAISIGCRKDSETVGVALQCQDSCESQVRLIAFERNYDDFIRRFLFLCNTMSDFKEIC